jgi:hypothetical protein
MQVHQYFHVPAFPWMLIQADHLGNELTYTYGHAIEVMENYVELNILIHGLQIVNSSTRIIEFRPSQMVVVRNIILPLP